MFPIWRDWFNPEWFSPANLLAEWSRHGARARLVRAITLAVVLVLCCVPETMALAAYVDAVGIDLILGLLGLQLWVAVALLFHGLRPALEKWGRHLAPLVWRRSRAPK